MHLETRCGARFGVHQRQRFELGELVRQGKSLAKVGNLTGCFVVVDQTECSPSADIISATGVVELGFLRCFEVECVAVADDQISKSLIQSGECPDDVDARQVAEHF